MSRRDDLIIKLAALQMKHYGVVDPAFVKEAADGLEPSGIGPADVSAITADTYGPGYAAAPQHGLSPAALAALLGGGGASAAAIIAALIAQKKAKEKGKR
jgi:hypothetical protein